MKEEIMILAITVLLIISGTAITCHGESATNFRTQVTPRTADDKNTDFFKPVTNYYRKINVTTDKQSYQKGEQVNITITNVDEQPIGGYPYLDIYNVSFLNNLLFWARPADMPDLYHIDPGERYTYSWDQKDMHENQVDAGEFMIIFTIMICYGPVARDYANFMIIDHSINEPPTPPVINGPTSGKPDETYTYQAIATDPNKDQIYYMFNWGDGTNSGWQGPYESGEEKSLDHRWSAVGNYIIRIKAKDTYNVESNWATLGVSMPKNKSINIIILFLERLIERFPILEQILQSVYDKLAGF